MMVFDSFQSLLETGWGVRSISAFSCVSSHATESTLVQGGAGSTLLIHRPTDVDSGLDLGKEQRGVRVRPRLWAKK